MKTGDKVTPKENHDYLNVTTENIGTVVEVDGKTVVVKFEHRKNTNGTIAFQRSELKVKK